MVRQKRKDSRRDSYRRQFIYLFSNSFKNISLCLALFGANSGDQKQTIVALMKLSCFAENTLFNPSD